jgi:hypothetical protein
MKHLIALAVLIPALATAECVLQDRTVTSHSIVIQERSGMRQTVVPAPEGGKRCIVNFRARVGATWYSATGQYDWAGDRPAGEACAVAAARADDSVHAQTVSQHVRSEKVMVCNDREDMNTLRVTRPGTVAQLHQFRPHPDYPNRFWHNGAQCRMFLDSAWTGRDIHTYQGVICQLQDNQWVVVDKY